MFRLKEDAPEGTLESLSEGLSVLAQSISAISTYSYGRDLGLREGNYDFAVVADFENAKAFAGYAKHSNSSMAHHWVNFSQISRSFQ